MTKGFARSRWAVVLAVLLATAACGGDSDGGGDIDIDAPDDEVLVGGDLDLPDWWPPGFEFPDDVEISSVAALADTLNLTADVTNGDFMGAHRETVDALVANGYELLSDDELFSVLIRDGVGRVRIRTSEVGLFAGINVDIDLWTDDQIDELRVLSAPEVRTRGVATAMVDGQTFEAAGECINQGREHVFVADDFSISASVDGFAEPTYAYADVTTDDELYFMDVDADRDYEVVAESPPVAFTVTGDVVSSTGEEFELTVEVSCDS